MHMNICTGLDKFKCSGCGLCFVDKKAHNHMYNCRKSSHAEGVVCHFMIGNYY